MVSVSVFGHARTVSILKCVHDIRKLTASLQNIDHNTLIYIVKGTVRHANGPQWSNIITRVIHAILNSAKGIR